MADFLGNLIQFEFLCATSATNIMVFVDINTGTLQDAVKEKRMQKHIVAEAVGTLLYVFLSEAGLNIGLVSLIVDISCRRSQNDRRTYACR